jgi:hypothetical protein
VQGRWRKTRERTNLREGWLQVPYQLISLLNVPPTEVEYNQIKPGFRNSTQEGLQVPEGIFSASENDQVMSYELIVEHLGGHACLKGLQLSLCGLSVREAESVARVEIDC